MSQFIGGRIVPIHGGVWDKTKTYEVLTIVLYKPEGDSYISRKAVPAGTAITDTSYWMLYSLYSQQIADAVKEMEQTESDLKSYVDKKASAMETRVKEAETLTNDNKDTLNTRMDGIDKRLDANVTASTDSNSDYAAEVVDARVDTEGTTYGSLGAHLRAVGDGSAITALGAQKLVYPDLSMKKFYNEAVSQNNDSFSVTYDEQTDTLRLVCLKDYTGDYILHAPIWTAEEYAAACKAGGKLYMKFKANDVKNNSGAIRFGLWMGKASSIKGYYGGSLINSTYARSVVEGVFEEAVPFSPYNVDFDEESGVYKKDDYFVNLRFLLYANSPKAGDEVTICGYGGVFQGISVNGGAAMFDANRARADLKETKDRIKTDEAEISRIAPVVDYDALDCRVLDFVPDGIFASDDSVCEEVKDEYGDMSYRITFAGNNPMYQMYLEKYLKDDDREVIVELQARNTETGGRLRTQLYDYTCGMGHMETESMCHDVTTDYRRYQFRLDCRNVGKTALGIGPETVADATIQFKDVKIYIPNAGSHQVSVPLKHFYGYPAELDFASAAEEKLDQPLIIGTDDYADADDLYLDSIDLYSTKQRAITFHIGCPDQYGLLQTVKTFTAQIRKGENHLKFGDRKIQVPAGNGVFAAWDADMAVYEEMPEWGYHNLISTKSNYFENTAGYSGYPLYETSYLVPMRFTLIEKPLNVTLEEIEDKAQKAQEGVDELKDSSEGPSSLTLIAPDGVKYSPTVNADGTISLICNIPKKVEVFGNSLTTGFGTFGMAASDSKHDYFYYVQQFLLGKNPDLKMTRHGASTWEGQTDSASRKSIVEELIQASIDGTEDLIIIQLSDNVNTDAKKETFAEDMYTILEMFRTVCPKARIVWIAAWYNYEANYTPIKNACTALGIDLVDIRDLAGVKANQSAVGNTYTKDDGTVVEITSSGVASHPGDTGMKLIADRVIELLESYM